MARRLRSGRTSSSLAKRWDPEKSYLIVETKVDFSESRNVLIAALILVLSIGINFSATGAILIPVGKATISFSGLATGSLVGIILNAVLPGKDYEFKNDEPNATGVDLEIGQGKSLREKKK